MGVLDELEWVTRQRADGDDETIILEPGLDAATIDALERRLGAPLPADLRTLLGACHGIRGLEWEIDFTGSLSFEMDEMFPHGLRYRDLSAGAGPEVCVAGAVVARRDA